MCIWKVSVENRLCECCSYSGGCERHPRLETPEGRRDWYVSAINEILGDDVMQRCRRKDLTWGRYMVAYMLRKDGMTQEKVGRLLGLDHSTVYHCEKQVERMLERPSMYQEEFKVWNLFISKI